MEQKLIISMLREPATTKTQKIYRSTSSYYKALWKLKKAELVSNRKIDEFSKEWKLTLDGTILAKVFLK
jgi:hypothetical protein